MDNMVIKLIPVKIIKPNVTDADVYEVVENMPEFPDGGMPGLMKYLSANIRYPEAAHKDGTQGRVTVQFVVGKDGSIGNVSILRGVDPALDAEAIRVISGMPKWKPGTQKGEPVNVKIHRPRHVPPDARTGGQDRRDDSSRLPKPRRPRDGRSI